MNDSELRRLIATGESATLEFKSSMRYDFETQQVNRELTKVVAKSLAGFLNTEGGRLFIGVGDGGQILGIDHDIATLSRKDQDYFERTLRTAIGNYLGIEISPLVQLEFVSVDDRVVAVVQCERHSGPVYLQEGNNPQFYVRDGNSTRPLNVKASQEYIATHFRTDTPVSSKVLTDVAEGVLERFLARVASTSEQQTPSDPANDVPPPLAEILSLAFQIQAATHSALQLLRHEPERRAARTQSPSRRFALPPWLRVATTRVVNLFLAQLAGSIGWKRIYIVSPWISELDRHATLSFRSFLRRVCDDGTTIYVVTRPPEEPWHTAAIEKLAATGRANIAFIDNLHAKLYTALTNTGRFAMLGSANFTQKSLKGREIGVLVNDFADGKQVVSHLDREAANIYRTPGRTLQHKATFSL